MQETPPRRRRPPPRDDGPSLPFIPIVLGVIVLGFVIGAGLSVAGRHGVQSDLAVPAASASADATPPALATLAPATLAPPGPAPTVRPTPRAKPSHVPASVADALAPKATSASTAAPAPKGIPAATVTPASTLTPAATVTPTPTTAPRPANTAAPATSHAHASAAPAVAPASAASVAAAPAAPAPVAAGAPAPAADDVDSAFGKLAASAVRSYIGAIARGDTDSAFADLGVAPGTAGATLPELGIVTRATRIVHVEARGGSDAVTVNVDMATPNGPYFGQFTVHRTASGAAVIVQHAIFKS